MLTEEEGKTKIALYIIAGAAAGALAFTIAGAGIGYVSNRLKRYLKSRNIEVSESTYSGSSRSFTGIPLPATTPRRQNNNGRLARINSYPSSSR